MTGMLEAAYGRDRDAALNTARSVVDLYDLTEIRRHGAIAGDKDHEGRDVSLEWLAEQVKIVDRATRVMTDLSKAVERFLDVAPGEGIGWLKATLYDAPVFSEFRTVRQSLWRATPWWKAKQRERSAKWYARAGSAARKTDEAKAKLATQARDRRAAKKKHAHDAIAAAVGAE